MWRRRTVATLAVFALVFLFGLLASPRTEPPGPKDHAAVPDSGPNPASPSTAPNTGLWPLAALQANTLWSLAPARGKGVKVAVVDTGIDARLRELAGVTIDQMAPGQRDQSPDSHGTEIAELIAGALQVNSAPMGGLAPQAELVDIPVNSDEDQVSPEAISDGINQAVTAGARVINVSLGTWVPRDGAAYKLIAAAVQGAVNHGCLVVAGAGAAIVRSGGTGALYPADSPGAVAVMATGQSMVSGLLVGHGPRALFAPGNDLAAVNKQGVYQRDLSGNDFAAAYVSASAALIWSAHQDLPPDELARLLVADTNPPSSPGSAQRGVLDPLKVLQALGPSAPTSYGEPWGEIAEWVAGIAALAVLILATVLVRAWRGSRPRRRGGAPPIRLTSDRPRNRIPVDWDLEPR